MSQGVYRLVRDLRPAQLDDLGLVAALQYLAEEEQDRAGLRVSVSIDGDLQRLDPLLETVLFRVAQEALTNVARHAQTDRAAIRLRTDGSQVILEIEDEGIGLEPAAHELAGRGWGLAGMRERAESMGGRFDLRSAPGAGTRVEVCVPLRGSVPAIIEEGTHEHDPVNAGG
jgi:two-component system sensor histidine kinase UhpB